RQPHPPQRVQPVIGLRSGHQKQPESQDNKAVTQDRADAAKLGIEPLAAGGNSEPPLRRAAGQDDRTLHDAQRLALELATVIDVWFGVEMVAFHAEAAIPERARGKVLVTFAADLPVKSAVGLQESLVSQRPVEKHLSI